MKRKKTNSLLIIIDTPGLRSWQTLKNIGFIGSADHVLLLKSTDFTKTVPAAPCDYSSFLEPNRATSNYKAAIDATGILAEESISSLSIIGHRSAPRLFNAILDELQPWFANDIDITIAGCSINRQVFYRLTMAGSGVSFHRCNLNGGWWRKGGAARPCESLSFWNCVGSIPSALEFGQVAWPGLTRLTISELIDTSHLSPKESLWSPPSPDNAEQCAAFSPLLAKAFWSQGLRFVNFPDCSEFDWLLDFPTIAKLDDYSGSGTAISPKVLEWLCRHRVLSALTISWEKDTTLPWMALAKLKRLRYLSVSSTFLTDDELCMIAQSSKLRTIDAYYTCLTAACWNTVFNWPSLRSFWASTEAMQGSFPTEFPDYVALAEVVALNARTEPFKELLARYPGVKIVEM